jgi:cell cycle checkpoint protein
MSKLSSFLSRHAYAPLEFASRSDHRPRRRLLLMSSLPNLSHPATRQAFYAALQDFAQSFQSQSCPLVIIASASGDGGRAAESWMERDRAESDIGKEIRDSAWCRTIEYVLCSICRPAYGDSFLPIAPTFLIKALNRIIPLAYPKGVARPPPEALQLIAQSSNGDLRSAVNSLEFLATQMIPKATGKTKASGGAKKTGKGSRGGRGAKIDASEQVRAL